MELADLVRAGPVTRRLAGMLALGLVLAAGRAAVPGARPVAVVVAGETRDEALLIDQGLRAGWTRTDPVIRRRLADNLRFAGHEGEEQALVEAAHALGMERVDPVVRARLLDRARRWLDAVPEATDAELQAWLDAHPERFAVGPILEVTQRPLDGGGASRELPDRLVGTADQLARRCGGDLAERAAALAPGERAEAGSRWGRHEITLRSRRPARIPALAEVREAVAQDWADARRRDQLVARLQALRAAYAEPAP